MHRYERWIAQRYFANALKQSRFNKAPTADKDIVDWLERCGRTMPCPRSNVEGKHAGDWRRMTK
jgi:hypothetical protein